MASEHSSHPDPLTDGLLFQPFQGLRQSCVKKPLTSTPGKTRNRKPQQDLANRSENKTDAAKALVSLHIRSSFSEENVTGLSATH